VLHLDLTVFSFEACFRQQSVKEVLLDEVSQTGVESENCKRLVRAGLARIGVCSGVAGRGSAKIRRKPATSDLGSREMHRIVQKATWERTEGKTA
jgi:hypothetical protein